MSLNSSIELRESPRTPRQDDFIRYRKQEKIFEVEILRYSNGLVDMIFDILCIQEKWASNADASTCMKCQRQFGLLVRKHHCRACGRVYCTTCSNYTLHLKCSKWAQYPDIIQVFTKQLKCIFNARESRFEMKICISCFQSGLDNQIAELTDIDGIKKFLKQSFTMPSQRQRKTSLTNSNFPLKERIQIEFMEFMLGEMKKELKDEAPSVELLKEFLVNIFTEFENLSKYKLDFNHINICDLIPVIRLPDTELSIEFFPGLILQLDSNTYYDQAHNISFPNILLLRKNFCPSKCKASSSETFKYFAVEDLDRINKSNIEFIENIISQKNINIVISEHALPAKIYFLLKSKKIDVIFPLKNSKINLIEKITKSSQLRTHFEKNYKHGMASGEVEELWLPGELEIKEVKILDRNFSYYAYIKKNNPRKSFNTFSIIVKGPMNKQTKIIKEKIQQMIPMLFYKFFEHTVVNSEMMLFNKFAKYDFSKSFLKSKISTMGHTHQLGNFIDTDSFFKSIMAREYKLDFYQTFCMLQTEENTFNEFQPHYKILIEQRQSLQRLLSTLDYNPVEFLSLFSLYNSDHFAFLANLNLSKSTVMLKLCDLPEQMAVRLFGQNDVNLVKIVLDILCNNEILCPNCLYKFKFHRRFVYVNMHVIKIQSYTIDYYNGDMIVPKIEQEPDLNFEKNQDEIIRPNQPNNIRQLDDGKLRFGLYCEDCHKIIGNLIVLPESYRNMSYALFLYLYTLDFDMIGEDFEGVVRDRKDTDKSTLFEAMFKTQNDASEICVHGKLSKAFLMNNNFVTYLKLPLSPFQLLTNNQLSAKTVDVSEKLNKASMWQKNFKLLVNYYIAVLHILEEMIFERPNEPNNKANLQIIERAVQFYTMLLKMEPVELSDKSQLSANRNFLKFYQELVNKYSNFRSFSCDLVISMETELKFDNIAKVLDFIQIKNESKSEQQNLDRGLNGIDKRIQETHSNIENSSLKKGSFSSNNTQSYMPLSKKSQQKTDVDNLSLPYQSLDSDQRNKVVGEFVVGEYEFLYFDNPVNKYANFLFSVYRARREMPISATEKQMSKEIALQLEDELELARLSFVLDSDDEAIFYMLMRENRLLLAMNFRLILAHKFNIPMAKSVKYKLKEYYPQAFESLRTHLKIEMEYFMHSLSQIENFNPSGGQTNASFFITRDNKYVVKEISKREFNYFMNFCLDYVKYMLENSSARSPSFLCRIFGVFKSERRIFVVMENLTYYINDVTTATKNYDLKGSELNRFKVKVKPNSTLTDTNYLIERNGDPLYLEASSINNFWQILSRDSLFLAQKNIIDYSLFVSLDVKKKVCFMKIIDYFRNYDLIKNVETKWKTMRNKELPTIINPQEYRARFLHNSRKYFIIPD